MRPLLSLRVGFGVLVLSFGILRLTLAQDAPTANPVGVDSDAQLVDRILNAPNPYPDTVATVNGESVSGLTLARRIEMLRVNYEAQGPNVPTSQSLEDEALASLVDEELIAQAAKESGLWPSQDEVQQQARKLKNAYMAIPADSGYRTAAEAGWAAQGITMSEMDKDPPVLSSLGRLMAIARYKAQVGRGLSKDGYLDMDSYKSSLSERLSELRAAAVVDVVIDHGP